MPAKPIRQPFFSQEHSSWVVPLTQGVVALVDADVVSLLRRWNWYANRLNSDRWYAVRTDVGPAYRKVLMHVEILGPRDGFEIDHRVHLPLDEKIIDNRRSNLRHCTRARNSCNQKRKSNASNKYKGVFWESARGKWRASISLNYRFIFIGRYASDIEAALAYDEAALRLHGAFALTNAKLGLLPPTDLSAS